MIPLAPLIVTLAVFSVFVALWREESRPFMVGLMRLCGLFLFSLVAYQWIAATFKLSLPPAVGIALAFITGFALAPLVIELEEETP